MPNPLIRPADAGLAQALTSNPQATQKELRFGGNHGYKNTGWFGPQEGAIEGSISTEISLGAGGDKPLYPAMTPNMSGEMLQRLLKINIGRDPIPQDIQDTARAWHDYRARQGKSAFWEDGDQVYPRPPIPLKTSK